MTPMDEANMLADHSAARRKYQRSFEPDPPDVDPEAKKCPNRAGRAEDGGIGGRGPWEPVRTDFTPGRKNEFMVKWLKSDRIKIKV